LGCSVAALVAASCRGHAPEGAPVDSRRSAAVAATSSDGDDRDPSARCDRQVARLVASTMRGDDRARPPRWEAHYSGKYDQCYVRIDRLVGAAGAQAIVSELWEAFDAALLAVHSAGGKTIDPRYCQVSLSDDPFTSCMVSKFFIDEHMRH
jgi:hypothetical protein